MVDFNGILLCFVYNGPHVLNELVPGNHSLKQTDLCLTSDYSLRIREIK